MEIRLGAFHQILGQPEGGDPVDQNAAHCMERLKQGDRIPLLGQVIGTGETGRSRADDCYMSIVGGIVGQGGGWVVGQMPVGNKPFQPADGHRVSLAAQNAPGLTLNLLWADTAGDGGPCRCSQK